MMSFGFSIGDFIALTQLALQTLRNTKAACGEHADLTREVSNLHLVLQRLELEISKPDSLVNNPEHNYRDELVKVRKSCSRLLRRLDRLLDKYNGLAGGKQGSKLLLQRMRFGSGEMQELDKMRQKLLNATSTITLYFNLILYGSQGRIERRMERDMSEIRQTMNLITAQMATRREGSLTAYGDDDPAVWREFRRTLVDQGYRSSVIDRNMRTIMAYVKELVDRGAFDDIAETSDSGASIIDSSSHKDAAFPTDLKEHPGATIDELDHESQDMNGEDENEDSSVSENDEDEGESSEADESDSEASEHDQDLLATSQVQQSTGNVPQDDLSETEKIEKEDVDELSSSGDTCASTPSTSRPSAPPRYTIHDIRKVAEESSDSDSGYIPPSRAILKRELKRAARLELDAYKTFQTYGIRESKEDKNQQCLEIGRIRRTSDTVARELSRLNQEAKQKAEEIAVQAAVDKRKKMLDLGLSIVARMIQDEEAAKERRKRLEELLSIESIEQRIARLENESRNQWNDPAGAWALVLYQPA